MNYQTILEERKLEEIFLSFPLISFLLTLIFLAAALQNDWILYILQLFYLNW